MRKRRMTRRMSLEDATVRIGKKGSTTFLIDEIAKQLDKRKTVKVKVLNTALRGEATEEIARKIASETRSEITELRGHTFIIHKPKKS